MVKEFQSKESAVGGKSTRIVLVRPWDLVGRALMGLALMGRALMGWALMGQAGPYCHPEPYGLVPWARLLRVPWACMTWAHLCWFLMGLALRGHTGPLCLWAGPFWARRLGSL